MSFLVSGSIQSEQIMNKETENWKVIILDFVVHLSQVST